MKYIKSFKIFESNLPPGAEYDHTAPWNEKPAKTPSYDTKFKLILTKDDYYVFKKNGVPYIAYHDNLVDNVDRSELAQVFSDGTYHGRDEDGEPIIDYVDIELTGEMLEYWLNHNSGLYSFGKGVNDFEAGVDIVGIDAELADYLKHSFNITV